MRNRGLGLPTVFFFAMVVYFLATVMLTLANQHLRATRWQSERTRVHYLAMAAVNEALVRLRTEPSFENRTEQDPYATREGDFEVRAWVRKDDAHPDILYVYGRAWPRGSPGRSQDFLRTVVRKPENAGIAFTMSPSYSELITPPIYVGATTGTQWKRVKPCPVRYYDLNGVVVEKPGRYATGLNGTTADDHGNLYACYDPFQDNGSAFAHLLMLGMQQLIGPDVAIEFMAAELAENTSTGFLGTDYERSCLVRYSSTEDEWSLMPPMPDVYYDESGRLVHAASRGLNNMMTTSESKVFMICARQGADFMRVFDVPSGTWDSIPPGPNQTYDATGQAVDHGGLAQMMFTTASAADGTLYCNYGNNRMQSVISRWDGDQKRWVPLPAPPRQAFDSEGRMVASPAQMLGAMTVDGDGSLYVVSKVSEEDNGLLDTVYKFENGAWSALPPVPEALFQPDGTLVETGRLSPRTDNLTFDAEGNMLIKAPNGANPDTTYKIDALGRKEALPPISADLVDITGQVQPQPGFLGMQTDLFGSGGPSTGDVRYDPAASF